MTRRRTGRSWDHRSWGERKAERREHFARFVRAWRLVTCTACSGSGRYDHDGSPACGGCDGTGRMRVPPGTTAATPAERRSP